jgi:hypothetical protein
MKNAAVGIRVTAKTLFSRGFLVFWGALALALVLAFAHLELSGNARLSNLDLTRSGFPDYYLMFNKTRADSGYLVNRRQSTIRRSRSNYKGKPWEINRFGADPKTGTRDYWQLFSDATGTVIFVPAEAVSDWKYPFYYGFVRREQKELRLPLVTWSQLYVNRVYKGLYLRMDLPFDRRKKEGRKGLRRELLIVRGDRMTLVNTRFNPDSRLYAELYSFFGIRYSGFPELVKPSPALAWLASRNPATGKMFLLSNKEPYNVTLLPLPVSIDEIYEKMFGAPPAPMFDERFRRWTEGDWTRGDFSLPPFTGALRARFDKEFVEYVKNMRVALAANRYVFKTAPFPELTAGQGEKTEDDRFR